MYQLFSDLPEALKNNYNLPLRCSYRPIPSKPLLPNISSSEDVTADDILKKLRQSYENSEKIIRSQSDE